MREVFETVAYGKTTDQEAARRLVLYVEDNPANIALMEDILTDIESIELIMAPTAEIGIELARARRPALIIMDIQLPNISGLDLIEQALTTQQIPFLKLTRQTKDRETPVARFQAGEVHTRYVERFIEESPC